MLSSDWLEQHVRDAPQRPGCAGLGWADEKRPPNGRRGV